VVVGGVGVLRITGVAHLSVGLVSVGVAVVPLPVREIEAGPMAVLHVAGGLATLTGQPHAATLRAGNGASALLGTPTGGTLTPT